MCLYREDTQHVSCNHVSFSLPIQRKKESRLFPVIQLTLGKEYKLSKTSWRFLCNYSFTGLLESLHTLSITMLSSIVPLIFLCCFSERIKLI